MLKSLKTIKNYYKTANVKWHIIFFEFIMLLIPSILSIVSPVLTAKIITSITVYDFKMATKLLIFDFLIIILTTIFYFIYHFLSEKVIKTILLGITESIYDTIKNNPRKSDISSAINSDVWEFSKFNSSLLYKLCFFIKSIIILIIISNYSYLSSAIIIAVSLLSSLLFSFTNKSIQKNSFTFSEKKVEALDLFNNIQKGIKVDGNEKIESSMKEKYFNSINEMSKLNSKISLFYNLNNNFITLILKIAVFGLTFYFISLIKSANLTLSIYLILTPYLTSSAQNLIAFFEIFPEIGIVQNILTEFGDLKYDKTKDENINDKIQKDAEPCNFDYKAINIKLSSNPEKNFSFDISFKSKTKFIFENSSDKKELFNYFLKNKKINNGTILLGEKNIENFEKDDYFKFVSFSSNNPYFYKTSILENLLAVQKNKTKILKSIKNLNLEKTLSSLPNKLETIVDENFDPKLLFLLGVLRASLLCPKALLIYEIPSEFSKTEIENFSQILDKLAQNCTIILFLHENINILCDKIVDFS